MFNEVSDEVYEGRIAQTQLDDLRRRLRELGGATPPPPVPAPRSYIGLNPEQSIKAEREYQREKWGVENDTHTWPDWLLILLAEVGEVADVIKRLRFDARVPRQEEELRAELVQVAAVAVAMVGQIDRGMIGPVMNGKPEPETAEPEPVSVSNPRVIFEDKDTPLFTPAIRADIKARTGLENSETGWYRFDRFERMTFSELVTFAAKILSSEATSLAYPEYLITDMPYVVTRTKELEEFREKEYSGGRRVNAATGPYDDEWPKDCFTFFGKDSSCFASGTWWHWVCFARNVLASRDVKEVAPSLWRRSWRNVDGTPIPEALDESVGP